MSEGERAALEGTPAAVSKFENELHVGNSGSVANHGNNLGSLHAPQTMQSTKAGALARRRDCRFSSRNHIIHPFLILRSAIIYTDEC